MGAEAPRAHASGDETRDGRVLAGVRWVALPTFVDRRGTLRAAEHADPVAFAPVRAFVVEDVPPGETRASHAVSCHELLWLLAGGCELTVDNGSEAAALELRAKGPALAVSAGVWMELRRFTSDAALLVLASERFAETRYFDRPQPQLVVELDA